MRIRRRASIPQILISVSLSIIFFVVGVFSLPLYGVNWDEAVHFGRGQAILHYFLTGKKDYADISPSQRISYFQNSNFTYSNFESYFTDYTKGFNFGAGHPTFSDVLASLSNYIFYQKLGIIGDIEAYHLYGIFLASFLVGIISYMVSLNYGLLAGIVAGLSLGLTPLFLGESRFNIKDIPEAVYYSMAVITAYFWVKKKSYHWLFVSAIFFGMAFSTKMNVVFAFFTIALWMATSTLLYSHDHILQKLFHVGKNIVVLALTWTGIGLIVYFASWPILWSDPWNKFIYNMRFYQRIGTEVIPQYSRYSSVLGLNTYAFEWVLYTTPLVILGLFVLGLIDVWHRRKDLSNDLRLLTLCWFLIPILRVSLPRTAIYGGVRQIMEYIPAMAILAGIGASALYTWITSLPFVKQKNLQKGMVGLILLSFLPITIKMIHMHPNESVYFNPIIRGLKGAKERNIPGWGNSLGSTYRQGILWLNAHAEPNAKLATVYELRSNIALIDIRSDIQFINSYRSTVHRGGEYLISATHEGTFENSYSRLYAERYLNPVYQLIVDGAPVLKIWKNDLQHTKEEYKKPEQALEGFTVSKDGRRVLIDLGLSVKLTRIHVKYENDNCTPPTNGYFEYALNDPPRWQRVLGDFQVFPLATWFKVQPEPGVLDYLFAAQDARYLQMVVSDDHSCLLTKPLIIQLFHI